MSLTWKISRLLLTIFRIKEKWPNFLITKTEKSVRKFKEMTARESRISLKRSSAMVMKFRLIYLVTFHILPDTSLAWPISEVFGQLTSAKIIPFFRFPLGIKHFLYSHCRLICSDTDRQVKIYNLATTLYWWDISSHKRARMTRFKFFTLVSFDITLNNLSLFCFYFRSIGTGWNDWR